MQICHTTAHLIVTMPFAHQDMGDLVEERVQHLLLCGALCVKEVNGDADTLPLVTA